MKIIVFTLSDETYGVDISKVKEVEPYTEPKKLPDIPDYVEGLINLRGEIIPVLNLKKKFNMKDTGICNDARIIILTSNDCSIGIIVDSASEVILIDDGEFRSEDSMHSSLNTKYVSGICKLQDNMIILLDTENLLK